MKVTKTFKITFNEPSPNWLCADNLALALHAYCKKTKFDVCELNTEVENKPKPPKPPGPRDCTEGRTPKPPRPQDWREPWIIYNKYKER